MPVTMCVWGKDLPVWQQPALRQKCPSKLTKGPVGLHGAKVPVFDSCTAANAALIAPLFDRLVGAREQRGRDRANPSALAGLEIYYKLKL
jgi:hypothetical protein